MHSLLLALLLKQFLRYPGSNCNIQEKHRKLVSKEIFGKLSETNEEKNGAAKNKKETKQVSDQALNIIT